MKRKDIISELYGDLSSWEINDVISEMNTEMNEFIENLATETGLPKREGYYFFLGRLGTNYKEYPFSWEPFRDVAGPLLRRKDSLPIVIVSEDSTPERPQIHRHVLPKTHYQIEISPRCPANEIATAWLELLSDDGAIAQAGGEHHYSFFFKGLKISPEQLSNKARSFINRFPERE